MQRCKMLYVGSSLLRKFDGWYSIQNVIFYQSKRRYPPPSVFFCTPPLFNSSLCSWFEIVSFVRKCKNLASMVIISRDIRCFMLALFYLENLMSDFQYKMWFSIRVREGMPHPQCFLLKCNYLQRYMMFYVGLVYLENLMGDIYKMWFSIRVRRGTLWPSVFFCTPPLFNSSLCSWFEIVSFVRKKMWKSCYKW